MDKDMARILANGGTAASRELVRLYDILKHHLPEDSDLRNGVASALAEIGLRVTQPAFDAWPELREEFELRLDKYGVAT
ncbi:MULTISPECIES: hypothetical protein [unclassified Sphingomonas]|uniref:hypothetical protein n=1 Tax=unclassified Sphingomonas TaxID=196159 RepID=UPI002150F90A|nr:MULTISPECIES: hypothetical protein [unclassified Sphingomonas]MCR5869860.1 hypothetical protein [Sphingomonas sp. J344]UUX98439.1 hypothetical protein LRS08_12800 [Sphingomonas sp. J315]